MTGTYVDIAADDGGRSVPYTHLRAHETVLDIVCRLLLEKKKLLNTRAFTPDIFFYLYPLSPHSILPKHST